MRATSWCLFFYVTNSHTNQIKYNCSIEKSNQITPAYHNNTQASRLCIHSVDSSPFATLTIHSHHMFKSIPECEITVVKLPHGPWICTVWTVMNMLDTRWSKLQWKKVTSAFVQKWPGNPGLCGSHPMSWKIQVCVLEPTPGITQCKHNASLENWRARFTFVLACIVGACPPQELSLVFAPNLCKFH